MTFDTKPQLIYTPRLKCILHLFIYLFFYNIYQMDYFLEDWNRIDLKWQTMTHITVRNRGFFAELTTDFHIFLGQDVGGNRFLSWNKQTKKKRSAFEMYNLCPECACQQQQEKSKLKKLFWKSSPRNALSVPELGGIWSCRERVWS